MSISPTTFTCDTPCLSSQFCGSDFQCHEFNCNEWYQFASVDYTDYDANLPLECVERSQFDEEFQDLKNSGVVFGCTGFSGSLPTPPEAVYQPFTKKCTRSDEDKLETFMCYEMADKTNFQPFVKEAQDGIFSPCDPELDGSPDVPSFIYQVTVGREVPGHGYHYMLDPGNSTEVFDRTIAMRTMSSSLTIAESTSPTLSPSSVPYTPSGGEVNGSFMTEPGALLCLGTIYLLRLFV